MLDKEQLELIHETLDKLGDIVVHAIFAADDDAALQECLRQYLRDTDGVMTELQHRLDYHAPSVIN